MCVLNYCNCSHKCLLFRLYSDYGLLKKFGCVEENLRSNCEYMLIIVVEEINKRLLETASMKYIRAAHSLLIHFVNIRNIIGDKAILQLCSSVGLSYVVLGLPDLQQSIEILTIFQMALKSAQSQKTITDMEYVFYENDYYLTYFQVLQLQKKVENYCKVNMIYDSIGTDDCSVNRIRQRLKAQWSASLYLLGKAERDAMLKSRARDAIEELYDGLDNSVITSLHYFVVAKLIEHYTELETFSAASEAVRLVDSFIEASVTDDYISSIDEAVNKTIFHRDAYKALKMIGDQRCKKHIEIAKKIAEEFNLRDQQNKIEHIENNWGNIALANVKYKAVPNDETLRHSFDSSSPYFFISYSHSDLLLVKNDINNLFFQYNYWIDFENLDGGRSNNEDDWTEKIKPVLENQMCKGVIIYCSAISMKKSLGMLLELEWLMKKKNKDIYTFLCNFDENFNPYKAELQLSSIDVDDMIQKKRISAVYSYILQTDKSESTYSYYFWKEDCTHLKSNDFVNWLKKIGVKKKGI